MRGRMNTRLRGPMLTHVGMSHYASVDPDMLRMGMVVGHLKGLGSTDAYGASRSFDRNAGAMNDRLRLLLARNAEVLW